MVELHECVHILDEAHATVAEHGAAGERRVLFERTAERFDDDFLFADELVHEQAARLVAGLDDDDDTVASS